LQGGRLYRSLLKRQMRIESPDRVSDLQAGCTRDELQKSTTLPPLKSRSSHSKEVLFAMSFPDFGVLFDVDGVLIDSDSAHDRVMNDLSAVTVERLRRIVHTSFADQ